MFKYIYRHIVRAPIKSLFAAAIALFLTFMLGFLQTTIANLNSDIDKLYNETIVYAEVRMAENFVRTRRAAGDIVSIAIVQYILETGIINDLYLEGSSTAFIVNALPDKNDNDIGQLDVLIGVNELQHLTKDHTGFIGRDDPFNMTVQFAQNYSENDFTYLINSPIPIVISHEIAESRNLSPGDSTYIIYYSPVLFRQGTWEHTPATVFGIHDGNGLPSNLRAGAVIPLPALENMLGDHMGYFTVRFTIDPAFNRQLNTLSEQHDQAVRSIFTYPRRDLLLIDMWDQELRFGVASLAQHRSLLTLLFPVIAVISAVIGAGLVMLSMLQNAKNAATIRILGMSKQKARVMLWLGQIIICICGTLAGLFLTIAMGLRTDFLIVIIPYLAGALIGATTGVILITNRPPLDLLQVKD